jgi:anti-anti-sigma factor
MGTGSLGGLDVDVVREGQDWLVRLVGDLDRTTDAKFRSAIQELLSRDAGDILLDLSDMRFFDAQGVKSIVWSSTLMNDHDRAMSIVGASRMVRNVLALTGDDKALHIVESRQVTRPPKS